MFDTAINFFIEHQYQLALPVLYCLYVALREFIKPIAELFIKPSLPSGSPFDTGTDDSWIREPLQSAMGKEWERTTGCTLESRKPTR